MIPHGWERRLDLELTDTVRAFGHANPTCPNPLEALKAVAQRLSDFRDDRPTPYLVLDLRTLDLHGLTVPQTLQELRDAVAVSGQRLVCLVAANGDGRESPDVFADEDELYDWLVRQGARRRQSSPVPLFTMTADEITALRTYGIPLDEAIRELERVPEPTT